MTRLTRNVKRLVVSIDRRGVAEDLVIELAPEGVYVRRPRQRRSGARLLPYAVIAWEGDKRAALALIAERKAQRAARRGAR